VVKISGTTPSKQRMEIVKEFTDKNIDILFSTDVLSEGQNLQSARILINYDLHWNPTRMIQRAGRIDRIGSPYDKIFIHNFFPEQELENLLKLVAILQQKIINIDDSIGLDQTILGEEIHPKVFGTIRRIKDKDESLLDELEEELFGGGEKFYQPLKDFSREVALGELEKLPHGIYSGLETTKIRGIFFYYKYADDFHFWYLYDLTTMGIIKTKSSIVDFISCDKNEERVIPDFFDRIYEINGEVLSDIELTYKEIEQKQKIDTPLTEIIRDKSTKFIQTIIKELDIEVNNYFFEFPEDRVPEEKWEQVKERMLKIPLTKRRLREIRKLWREYQKSGDWKKLMGRLDDFLKRKKDRHIEPLKPYDPDLLKLVVIDFIS
jgi:SNF2 family DNA or RNA helicase